MNDENPIETLNLDNNPEENSQVQDIPHTFFQSISDIQDRQQKLVQNYESADNIPDLSSEVRSLEQKLAKKKYYMPLSLVLILVLLINLLWFLGVKFLIVPKYEEYVQESSEMKANYETLKSKVDAIVGEE